MNPMKTISIGKVTINIGCGEPGEKLDKAKKLLETLTGKKVVFTKTENRTTFGTPKGRTIGCKVTLRGEDAISIMKRALDSNDFKLKKKSFDKQGNFSFGVKEHIHMPGVKYDPTIGIYGMDICVTLNRPGYRVSRKRDWSKVGKKHMITAEEAIEFMVKNFNVIIE